MFSMFFFSRFVLFLFVLVPDEFPGACVFFFVSGKGVRD